MIKDVEHSIGVYCVFISRFMTKVKIKNVIKSSVKINNCCR